MTNCKRLHVRIDSIQVNKSESYGFFGEPGASAEWRMNFTVQDQSKSWNSDYVRDKTNYVIGYDFFVDLSPSQTVSIRASGFEHDDSSANDVLPYAEVTQKPADNWNIGATYSVSSQSDEDFQYTVYYSIKCAQAVIKPRR